MFSELAAFIALGSGVSLTYAAWAWLRKSPSDAWELAIKDAHSELSGSRVSTGGDGPELRVENDGLSLTLRVRPTDGTLEVVTALKPDPDRPRCWLGWDIMDLPKDWMHVAEVVLSAPQMEGEIRCLSDDASMSQQLFKDIELDLVDIRREAQSLGVSVSARGGYLRLSLPGSQPSAHAVTRLVPVTTRIARFLTENQASPPP